MKLTLLTLGLAPLALGMNVSNILLYTYTAGYRHDSIPTAVQALTTRGADYGINFSNSEDPDCFTDDNMSQYDALMFISNTDEVLTAAGRVAFQNYLDNGGNFIAVHAASDCMLNFTTMERTLGSQFAYHPDFTNATIVVADPDHPSTVGLPPRWRVQDEIYNFNHDPRNLGAVVVLTADETSYVDDGDHSPTQGSPHPIAWYQEHLKGTNTTGPIGRSWYTGLGHSNASWADDLFLGHVFGGITWTLASNTTRAMNPSGTVGSLGPSYTPPAPAPTTTADLDDAGLRSSASLSLVGAVTLLSLVWGLHMF
jgi:type 1 glutamine amidotransferase